MIRLFLDAFIYIQINGLFDLLNLKFLEFSDKINSERIVLNTKVFHLHSIVLLQCLSRTIFLLKKSLKREFFFKQYHGEYIFRLKLLIRNHPNFLKTALL